jgi:hypothetical protein
VHNIINQQSMEKIGSFVHQDSLFAIDCSIAMIFYTCRDMDMPFTSGMQYTIYALE